MAWIILIYIVISGIVSFTAISSGWSATLSAAGTSLLSVIAGSGLRGSLYGTKTQKVGGFVFAAILIGIAYWLGHLFSAHLFDFDFTGSQWGVIGFVISLVFTPKWMALK
jgi:hypothetical protein